MIIKQHDTPEWFFSTMGRTNRRLMQLAGLCLVLLLFLWWNSIRWTPERAQEQGTQPFEATIAEPTAIAQLAAQRYMEAYMGTPVPQPYQVHNFRIHQSELLWLEGDRFCVGLTYSLDSVTDYCLTSPSNGEASQNEDKSWSWEGCYMEVEITHLPDGQYQLTDLSNGENDQPVFRPMITPKPPSDEPMNLLDH